MIPPAPGLLSTTNGWPSDFVSWSPTTRPRMSVADPGVNGTMTLTAFAGYCACAKPGAASKAASNAAAPTRAAMPGGTLFIPDVDDLVAFHAAGRLHLDALAGFLADERAGDRRAHRDAAFLDVGLVLADDLPGYFLAAVALDVHGGAEHAAPVGVDQPGVDHLRVGELRLDVADRSEEHTSELQSPDHLVCRLLLEKKKTYLQYIPF